MRSNLFGDLGDLVAGGDVPVAADLDSTLGHPAADGQLKAGMSLVARAEGSRSATARSL